MGKSRTNKLDRETINEIAQVVGGLFRAERSEIIRLVVEQCQELERKTATERYDKRLRNTKLLLKNYRELVAHSEKAIYNAAQAEDEDVYSILEMMSTDFSGLYVESIKTSAARTRIVIDHVNAMLELYEVYCHKSPRSEDRRRYRTIQARFLMSKPMTVEQIAEKEDVEPRTVYRDIDVACEKLTALIFGVDGLPRVKVVEDEGEEG